MQPAVINGFSELMAEVFGADTGVGARSAVGATSLPGNMAVEVEAIFEIDYEHLRHHHALRRRGVDLGDTRRASTK